MSILTYGESDFMQICAHFLKLKIYMKKQQY